MSEALVAVALAATAHPAAAQTPTPGDGHYVGSQVCQACHPNLFAGFRTNAHYDSVAAGNLPPERTGCEGCHGPGGLHATTADREKILRFPEMAPIEAQDRCLACHTGDLGKMHIRRSVHLTSEVGCASCHSIHSPHESGPLLAGRERELCYGCHQEIRARFEMPYKHRVNEGAMQCTDCHNPHGAPVATWATAHAPRMVSHAFGNDQPCVKCHIDKRGPFVFEHPPVREGGCTMCHNPHGSTNPRLLARPVAFTLCLECHNEVDSFGTRGAGIRGPTPGFHDLTDPSFRQCVVCHSRIHGSNADPSFRR